MIRRLAICAVALAGLFARAQGAVLSWDGGGGNYQWANGLNWDTNAAPQNDGSADLHFAGGTRLRPYAEVAYAVNSLTFDANASNFILDGAGLTLGAGGLTQNSATWQTINSPITLAAPSVWKLTAPFGTLTIGESSTTTVDDPFRSGLTVDAVAKAAVALNGAVNLAFLQVTGGGTVEARNTLTLEQGFRVSGGTLAITGGLLGFSTAASQTPYAEVRAASMSIRGTVDVRPAGVFLIDGTSAGSGTVSISTTAGRLLAATVQLGANGIGLLNQSGGIHTIEGSLKLGATAAGAGNYTLSGGSLSAPEGHIGELGRGYLRQTAGASAIGSVVVGAANGSNGTFEQTGGSASFTTLTLGKGSGSQGAGLLGSVSGVAGTLTVQSETIGEEGTATFTQDAGTHSVAQSLALGTLTGGSGTFTLSGGILRARTIVGGAGSSVFKFNRQIQPLSWVD